VLLVSEDLDELLELSDRIVVMSEGRIVFECRAAGADRRTLDACCGLCVPNAARSAMILERHLVHIEPLQAATFRPYGEVIEASAATPHFPVNRGDAVRYDKLSGIEVLDAAGHASISIFRARPHALSLRLTVLERHRLGSQAFMPLSPNPTSWSCRVPGRRARQMLLPRSAAATANTFQSVLGGTIWNTPTHPPRVNAAVSSCASNRSSMPAARSRFPAMRRAMSTCTRSASARCRTTCSPSPASGASTQCPWWCRAAFADG
jgi:Ureidoglycolate lyase